MQMVKIINFIRQNWILAILFIALISLTCKQESKVDYAKVVHTFNKAWNTGEYELLHQTVHPEYYKQEGEMVIEGVEPLIDYVKNWRKSLPGAKIIYVEEVYGEDKAAIRFTLEGTPVDTGNKFKAEGIVIFKFKDGKIIEDKSVFDQLTSLQQQGYSIIPPTDNK
jgi:predicted SnoaL-like aldol condensation-catalyzing enzyme